MNVNPQFRPMLDQVICVKQPETGLRAFRDDQDDLWFEVAPDEFVYTWFETRQDAERIGDNGVRRTLSQLEILFPKGYLTDH